MSDWRAEADPAAAGGTHCPFSLGIVTGVYGLIAGLPLLSRPLPSTTGFMRRVEATVKPESCPSGSSKMNFEVLWLYGCHQAVTVRSISRELLEPAERDREPSHLDCLQLEGGELARVEGAVGCVRSARGSGRGCTAELGSLGLALLDLLLNLCLYLLDGVGRGALQVVVATC